MGPEVRPGTQQPRNGTKKVFHCLHPPQSSANLGYISAVACSEQQLTPLTLAPSCFRGEVQTTFLPPTAAPAAPLVAILPCSPFLTLWIAAAALPRALPPLPVPTNW